MNQLHEDGYNKFKWYCRQRNCIIKVIGDYAFKTKRYNQANNFGRLIRLKAIKTKPLNHIEIYDSKIKDIVKMVF